MTSGMTGVTTCASKRSLSPTPKKRRTICIAGADAGPTEEVGSTPGYKESVQVVSNARNPLHSAMWCWYAGPCNTKGFDMNTVNAPRR